MVRAEFVNLTADEPIWKIGLLYAAGVNSCVGLLPTFSEIKKSAVGQAAGRVAAHGHYAGKPLCGLCYWKVHIRVHKLAPRCPISPEQEGLC